MRQLLFLSFILFPMFLVAAPICPAGYILNGSGKCEKRWEMTTGNCTAGYYQDATKQCLARCPYGSEVELSAEGDYVCQKHNKREWMAEYRQKCTSFGMEYEPAIDKCLGTKKETNNNSGNRNDDAESCPAGKLARFEGGVFSCVKGDAEKIAKKLQKKLQKEGLSYLEYLEAVRNMQTTRMGAEVMQYRWEEATGKRQTKQQKAEEIRKNTVCPEGYTATTKGGCTPLKSCSNYGCPVGQKSILTTQGKNQFCRCVAAE